MRKLFLLLSLTIIAFSCQRQEDTNSTKETKQEVAEGYKTENVILLVVDGPRMSETWGKSGRDLIPNRVNLLKEGVFINNFRNDGATKTNPGHAALITGVYEDIDNTGKELPQYPSILQQWLKATKKEKTKAWVIASKDKLEILNDCKLNEWKGKYNPSTDCGNNGNGTGYREDKTTIENTKKIMIEHKPNLIVINLKDVDAYGHAGQWDKYIEAIQKTDESIKEIWDFVQSTDGYKGKTTLIVSNDHGRHLDNNGGYNHHGDSCEGCRHIEFFAIGPDFKKNIEISGNNYGQIDVSTTIAELMGIKMEFSKGRVMKELFTKVRSNQ